MIPRRRIIPIFVPHAGCPHDCVFCNQRRISGTAEPTTPEKARRIIDAALEKGVRDAEAAFYGGSFTAIPVKEQTALLSVTAGYMREGKISSVRLSTRPDCVGAEEARRLLRFGVGTVELGVQSLDEEVLLRSGRGHTAKDAEEAFRLLKEAGFSVILQMMTGLPGDTPAKSAETARRIASMRPDGVRIYPTVIVRDTQLYDMWMRGEYREHTVDEAAELCAKLCDIFEKARVPVIRLGLNPTDELSAGDAVGGAYHPAFGEIVQSRRYLQKERCLLSGTDCRGADVIIGAARGQISAATGQHRVNIRILTESFGLRSLKIRESDVEEGCVEMIKIAKP